MYKKRDRDQQTLEGFNLPYNGKLKADNRWIKLAALMPWDFIEYIYAESMCPDNGAGAISSRIAFGSLFIKENEKLTDERTVEYIAENAYMQYFLGLLEFQEEPLFDPSMMVHFRKRFPADKVEEINKRIFTTATAKDDDDSAPPPNSGKLVLDATCAPADIRYPSDVSLLNEARENTEEIIDELWEHSDRKGHKTTYNRKKARGQYLSIAKQKKPKVSKTQKAIAKQLEYIGSNIDRIVGPTGAGKTTMVNLLMRFYELQSGCIKIDNIPIDLITRENVHNLFCMVLQDTWLFEGTIRDNLVYNKAGLSDGDIETACKAAGVHNFILGII